MQLIDNLKLNQDSPKDLLNLDLESAEKTQKLIILVVDDNKQNLQVISDFLSNSGFEVRIAKSGSQALKILEKQRVDLILLDVRMPEMDGFETCRYLKQGEKTKDIPVILMTAIADSANSTHRVKGLTLGAVDYISKPIQLEEVLARVNVHLHLRCLTQQLQAQNARLQTEIRSRQLAQEELAQNLSRSALRSDIAFAVSQLADLSTLLRLCADAFVQHLGVAFARIWTLNRHENMLELQASAGMYTHINGSHARVPVGSLKIGRIASERQPHLTNNVLADPRLSYPEWARREGMVAFAGYPLMVEDRLVGVMAMFSRQILSESTLQTLASVAREIAVGIEHKWTEAALKKREAQLAQAQQVAHVGNWEFDVTTQTMEGSQELFRIFGLNPSQPQPTYLQLLEQIHPDDRELFNSYLKQAIAQGISYQIDTRIVQADGEIRHIEIRGKPIFDQHQSVIKLFGTVLDITERKQTESEIIRTKDLMESIFNESTDALFLVSVDTGLIVDCNQQAVALFAAEHKHELLNIEDQTLQKEQFSPDELARILQEIDRHGVWSQELEYVTKKGEFFWGNLAAKQIQVAGQTMNLVRVTDITARKQAEARQRQKAEELKQTLAQLKRTQAQLIQAEKMSSLGRMVAGVAHEINNPVSFIYGNLRFAKQYFQDVVDLLQLYQKTYPNPTPEICQLAGDIDLPFLIEDWLSLIHSMDVGAERITEIIQSLKCFSRLDEAELKEVDIHQGIDHTVVILQHRLRAAGDRPGIEVIKDYGQLPLITCHASQLNQVLMNILDNGIDALDHKAPPRQIKISTTLVRASQSASAQESFPMTDVAMIRITDNGSGMSEEVAKQIFDPFFTTKPIGQGTGLGLAISHHIIVEKHGGQIRCVSVPGQGTEVIVEIPVNCRLSPTPSHREFKSE